MVAIRLSAIVGKDRQITIKLPDEIPEGEVDLELRLLETPINPEREQLREKLLRAGKLALYSAVDLGIPSDTVPLSVEELMRIGRLPPGAPSSEVLVDEDRGER